MTRTEIESRLAERLHNLASRASATPRHDPALAEVEQLPTNRRRPAEIAVSAAAAVAAAVVITFAVTRDSGPARSRVRVGGAAPSVSVPSPPAEPASPAVHELTIEASNFRFQGFHFDVPAGITDVRLVSSEGSHTLAFADPDLAYVNLAAPGSRTSVKVDFVAGRTYTIFCALPGHRASGMEATITVGPPDSQMNTVAPTIPASAIGR